MAERDTVTPRTQSQVQSMATYWSEWAAAHEELLLELDSSWDAEVLPAPAARGTRVARDSLQTLVWVCGGVRERGCGVREGVSAGRMGHTASGRAVCSLRES